MIQEEIFQSEREKLMQHYKAARELLVTGLVILKHGQVTRTALELSPPSPNYHIAPTGYLSLDRFNVQRRPLHGDSSVPQARTHDTPATNS
ncbi:hypothetical protein TNCV_4272521 [Trichonephila clavipes]|nr:hypothetical protein TNCV_4272521 [Trichonephila clavipes]